MALTTIEPMPNLTLADRRRAHRAGPNHVAVRTSYRSLLTSAGFRDVEHRDVTDEYRASLEAWQRALRRRSAAIEREIGTDAHEERLATGRGALAAIEAGLLSRSIYCAMRP